MFRKTLIILTSGILCVTLHAQDVPNAAVCLPSPPTPASDLFICDNYQYTAGKTERVTARGLQAARDMIWDISSYISIYADILGISESSIKNSTIYDLLNYGMRYGEMTINAAQSIYRERPYVYFNEPSLLPEQESQYGNVSSYPANQTTIGFLFALLLTEVCPGLENQLLARGLEFGPSTVISGYNWDSDAYAGFLLASCILSRLHTHDGFSMMLDYAKADYKRLSKTRGTRFDDSPYFSEPELPVSSSYLPAPPATNSAKYTYDLAKYEEGKSLRNTREGLQAIADVEYSADNFCKIYSRVLGITISASNTPAIYELVSKVHPSGNAATQSARGYYLRKRPYVEMDEHTSYIPDEAHLRESGSFPSGHASGSWLVALVLSEVTHYRQDELMARAYQFGQGRVITGYHWQTDVDYGRIVGSAVYAHLHTSKAFVSQVEKAAREFQAMTTGIQQAPTQESAPDAPIYTLDGIRLNGKPTRHGIYIQNNRKIAY